MSPLKNSLLFYCLSDIIKVRSVTFSLLSIVIIFQSLSALDRSVIRKDFFNNSINWTQLTLSIPIKEEVLPIHIQRESQDSFNHFAHNISEARNKALSTAKEKIQLHAVRSIEQIRYDSHFTVLEKIQNSSEFRERFNEYILKENFQHKVRLQENSIFVEANVGFLGSDGLMNSLTQEYNSENFPEFDDSGFISKYTGLIIDARHLKITPALFPKIITEKGVEIYSAKLVHKANAIDKGYIVYYSDLKKAIKDPRIGSKPYITLAQSALGKHKTDLSILTRDAKKLLASPESKAKLQKCSVIILVEP
jgi:hypothetical protein